MDCVNTMELVDLAFSGCFFTWTNNREGDAIVARKLDRVMSNEYCLDRYGQTSVDFLEAGVSDDLSALISVGRVQSFDPKPFKFSALT